MSFITHRGAAFALALAAVVSFSGCEKVQKFVDYLSPQRKPVQQVKPSPKPKAAPATQQEASQSAAAPEQQTPPKDLPKDVLAQVGGWTLTLKDFNDRIAALDGAVEGFNAKDVKQKKYVLGQIVQQQILAQEALKQKMDQTKEAKAAMENFRSTLLAQMFVKKAAEGIQVSDKEVEDFYKENEKDMVSPFEWRVREIVVDSEDKAKEILVELNEGAPFDTVAREKSIADNASQGGDLGFLQLQTFPFEKMAQVVSALDEGGVSGAFKGPEGVYIVKLVEKKGGEKQAFEDIKKDLRAYVLSLKQQQTVFDVLQKAQKELKININEQLLEEQGL